MVHVGKYQPVCFDRDLCGEFAQRGAFVAPKRWEWVSLSGGSGSFPTALGAHRDRSFPAFRIDNEQHLQWEWDVSHRVAGGFLQAEMIWDPDARTVELRFHAECSGLTHADMICTFSPMAATHQAWIQDQAYSTATTTNSAIWDWGSTGHRFVHLGYAGWPDEPNP